MENYNLAKQLFLEGLDFFRSKNFAAAEKKFYESLSIIPDKISTLINLCSVQIELGNLLIAKKIAYKIISLEKNNIDAYLNLGIISVKLNKLHSAIFHFECALNLNPEYAEAYSNKGNVLLVLKFYEEAMDCYSKALSIKPDYAEGWSNKGNALYELKRYDEAIAYYDKALSLKPDYAEGWSNKGNALYELKRYDEAIDHHDKALSLKPDFAEGWSNKGLNLNKLKRYDEAIAYYDKALSLKPDYAEGWSNKGNALYELEQYDEAITHFDHALSLKPDYAEGWSNKGTVLFDLDRYDEAEQCYLEAENIDKSYDTNTYNYALLLLGKKQFPIGWKKYKYRWKWDGFTSSPLQTSKPEWLGNRSTNRLLLWGEQGIGDQILYASMLSDLQSFPQEKIVAVNKKLLPIFIRSFPNFSFIGKDEFLPEEKYDEHFPLGDLGGFFRTDVASFESARFPYLVDDAARTNTIRGQLSNNRNLKCGVSWKSSNRDVGDSKSMALSEWMPLLQKNEIDFINLQYGDTVDELEKLRANNIHINEIDGIDLFEDVDGALSIIQACDIIITVSNTTAHLAGALGKKTYLLLSKGRGKFWYWHQSKNKNLWYPSVQIIEQDSPGDWNSAVQKLITEIEK